MAGCLLLVACCWLDSPARFDITDKTVNLLSQGVKIILNFYEFSKSRI
jgi:hypothetical protein